jgi:dolichol-phosphate mannosyltransferase
MNAASISRKLAIIPVYDPIGNIDNILQKFKAQEIDEICLVVDCPKGNILRDIESVRKEINIETYVITHPKRMGVGYAIREGIKHALDHGFELVVVMAGNEKDDPREIPRLLEPIISDGYDYVQGSRFLPGGSRVKNPILRGVFSRLYPLLWTLATDVRCTDVTNGFRAFKTSIFKDKRININQSWLDGYGLEYYLHFKVLKLHYRTKEVPVSKIYPYRHKGGYSKISPFRDWWQIVGPFIYLTLGVRK